MLTPLGKALRKLRIDRGWLLKDMAAGVGVASSYLSAVETGRKRVSDEFVQKIRNWGDLTAVEWKELSRAWALTRDDFTIQLGSASSDNRREAAAMLARSFDELSEEQVFEIQAIVKRKTGRQ